MAARWVVASCAVMAMGAAMVVYAGTSQFQNHPSRATIQLQPPSKLSYESLEVAPLSFTTTRAKIEIDGILGYQMTGTPPGATTGKPPVELPLSEWMTDDEVRQQAPRLQGSVRRLRDVVEGMRRKNGNLPVVVALDVHVGFVPLGVVIRHTHGTDRVLTPASVRRAYPLVFTFDNGSTWVMIRAWSIAGWAVGIGGLVALAPPGFVVARRMVRGRAGRCVWCGYELGGIGDGAVCPECGGARGE